MAQLKDTVVSGSLRATDSLLTTTIQASIFNLPTTSGGTTYGPGTSGNVVSSNGTSVYWRGVTDNSSSTAVTSSDTNLITGRTLYYAGYVKSSGVTSITIKTTSPLTGGSSTATTGTGTYTIALENQNANVVLAGPGSGSAAAPSFRSLVAADIPSLTISKISDLSTGSTGITKVGTISTGTWKGTTIGIGYGGTGTSTAPTKNGIIYASSTTAYASTAAGSDGYILIGKGANTAPTWQEILPIAHGGTGTKTAPTQWGIIYASATTTYASTGAGTAGYLLQSNATSAPTWIQATDSNTVSTIVKRDASGNFSAGTITASLTGTASKATADASGNTITTYYCTLSTDQTISGTKTLTGSINIGTSSAGGILNGSATDGGINTLELGNDVWIGDCNTVGVVGIKSTSSTDQTGLGFYTNTGSLIGTLISNSNCLSTSQNFVAGHYVANTGESQDYLVRVSGGAGMFYMYSQKGTTENRGLYGCNSAGTYAAYLTVDKDNNVTLHGNAATASDLSFTTDEAAFGGRTSGIICKKHGHIVILTIQCTTSSAISAKAVGGTIPDGYRPSYAHYYQGVVGSTLVHFGLYTDGTIKPQSAIASGADVRLDCVYTIT